jgi:hypothetical protein
MKVDIIHWIIEGASFKKTSAKEMTTAKMPRKEKNE